MKQILGIVLNIFIFLSLFVVCNAQNDKTNSDKFKNKIDNIQTVDDIDKLLDSVDRKRFDTFIVREKLELKTVDCGDFSEKIQAKSWTKADFDNNGFTDILIIGDSGNWSVVVLDKGNNNFIFKSITKGFFQNCSLPVVRKTPNQTFIDYLEIANQLNPTILTYKFGDFVETNDSPQTHKIEKIEYKTSGCFGTCPIFELAIDSNRQAAYKPIAYNKKKKGTFKGIIRNFEYNELVGLLNYIDFANLKDSYSVSWTDDQSSVLTVTYDGGKIKKTSDYGLIGTFGLSRVYEMLFELRETQSWK